MRFFISSDIKKNRTLYFAVLFFMVFSFLFWLSSWLHFYAKYTFSYEGLVKYFFTDPEYPERISISQLSEDLHVSLFLHSFILLVLFSLFNLVAKDSKLKSFSVVLVFSLATFYILSDLLIYFLNQPAFVWLKFASFIIYQTSFIIVWLYTLFKILNAKPPSNSSLRLLVFLFSIFSLIFFLSNFLNFYSKMGLNPEGIRNYYLGNPQLFIKKKTFEGVFKVFYPHLLAMSIYCLTLAHLLPFAGLRQKTGFYLGILLFTFSSIDNLSSILILYTSSGMAELKLLSFICFHLIAFYCCLVLLRASVKKGEFPALYV